MKRTDIIWDNLNVVYDDWRDDWKEYLKECEMRGEDADEDFYEWVDESLSVFLDDERCNLDVETEGVIVAFADLGLWNGRTNGAKVVGTNVSDILYDKNCEYAKWYCDRYNVRFEGAHHDGRNRYLYRVAKDKETAQRLVEKIAFGGMGEKEFMRATKSLRPYVASVFGW